MKAIFGALAILTALLVSFGPADAKPGRGELYYDGTVVRTVVPPAAMPREGRDALYDVMGNVEDQRPVIAVAPGDRDYHGGQWAVHLVEWNTDPYLLTSDEEVLAAEANSEVTITRVPENDFKCPVQR